MPLQVPSKDGFCRALREAQQHTAQPAHKQQLPAHEQQRQPTFSLSKLAQKIYRPIAGQQPKKAQQTVPRRQLSERQQRVYSAPAPAPSYQRQQQQGASVQPQGSVSTAQSARSAGTAGNTPLVANGQLSQNVNGNGARFGSQGYQTYTPASPQRLSSQEATANPSLVDAGTSSSADVASNAQQQLRAAPTAQAGTR